MMELFVYGSFSMTCGLGISFLLSAEFSAELSARSVSKRPRPKDGICEKDDGGEAPTL